MNTQFSKKRIIKDITDLYKNPLTSHGIYYIHHTDNIFKAYAMILGPNDTPYAYGFYFFEIDYPSDYPFSPPIFTFKNYDCLGTRYNPNLYRSGKVCLSILNTWHGEKWSSCQSISTILLVLTTVLNNKPLLNEPGITEEHNDFFNYNLIITQNNINFSINEILNNLYFFIKKQKDFDNDYSIEYLKKIDDKTNKLNLTYISFIFAKDILNILNNNYSNILKHINFTINKYEKYNNSTITTNVYNLKTNINFDISLTQFNIIYKKLKNS